MGRFLGHILPFGFFGVRALWWCWSIFNRYFMCMRENDAMGNKSRASLKTRYRSNAIYFLNICGRTLPAEGAAVVLFAMIGMIGELATSYHNGEITYMHNLLHLAIYFFAGISGAINIHRFHSKYPLLDDLEYVAKNVAYGMEAFLFFYRVDGIPTSPMSIQVYHFLIYSILGCLAFGLVEMKFRSSLLAGLGRTFFTILQGTWFLQIAFTLYHRPLFSETVWDGDSQDHLTILTFIFASHIAGIFVFMYVFGLVIYYRVSSMDMERVHRSLSVYYPPSRYNFLENTDIFIVDKLQDGPGEIVFEK